MNIILFICGMLGVLFLVVATTWTLGWSMWSVIAISVATLVVTQLLYVVAITAKASRRVSKRHNDTAFPPHKPDV